MFVRAWADAGEHDARAVRGGVGHGETLRRFARRDHRHLGGPYAALAAELRSWIDSVGCMGEMVSFASNGDTASGYLAVPTSGSGPGVLVLQEWWGLVPQIKRTCDRLAAEGFVALAPDLYRGDI